ncbi:MAG: hypothetical protein TE42_09100, partial [Candidatus Synechococcus spongiarum SP3]
SFPDDYTFQWVRVDGGDVNIPGATSQTYTLVDADVGTTIKVEVTFTDGGGTTETLEQTTTAIAAATPGPVQNLLAIANGHRQIDLSWDAPASDGGAAVTGYRIEESDTDLGPWGELVASQTATTYSHTGLTTGSTKYYRVSAINSAGAGSGTIANATTAGATVPGPVQNLSARANGQTQIDLSWSPPASSGSSPVTGYRIEESDTGATGSWSELEVSHTSTSYSHTGLTTETTKHYRVSAINSEGTGSSTTANATTAGLTNNAPEASDNTVRTTEDTAYTFTASDFNFSDANPGDTLSKVTIVTVATDGNLELNGANVTPNQEVTKTQLDNGNLVFTPAADANGAAYAIFTFKVNDGTDESALSYTMTIAVTSVNDPALGAPTITGVTTVGQTLTANAGTMADADGLPSTPFPTGYTFQWVRVVDNGDVNISGATSRTYTTVDADAGRMIKVKVIFTDGAGTTETLTSEAVAASAATKAPNVSWMGRFARTVADQVLDAAGRRMQAASTPDRRVVVAGVRFDGLEKEIAGLSASTFRTGNLLTSSSFALTPTTAPGEFAWSIWGQGAVTSFDGVEGDLSLDGTVATALLGADWVRESSDAPAGNAWGDASVDDRWRAGLLLSHSRGDGDYTRTNDGSSLGTAGKMEARLTGLFPWARRNLNRQLAAWGLAGYGQGDLTMTPRRSATRSDAASLTADLNLWVAAGGLHGTFMDGGNDGLTVTGKTDVMVADASHGRVTGDDGALASAQATVTRLRLGLEASQPLQLESGATLTPSLEAGLRHDRGEAETGFGLDLGGGITLSSPEGGLEAELRGRGLLFHAAEGFRDRGFSASLAWQQKPDSHQGVALSLSQSAGASSSGGVDALLSAATLDGLVADANGNDDLDNQRLELKLSYGLPTFRDGFTLIPELGLGLYDSGRDYQIGWRLIRLTQTGSGSFEFSFDATRQENTNSNGAAPEHGIQLELNTQF